MPVSLLTKVTLKDTARGGDLAAEEVLPPSQSGRRLSLVRRRFDDDQSLAWFHKAEHAASHILHVVVAAKVVADDLQLALLLLQLIDLRLQAALVIRQLIGGEDVPSRGGDKISRDKQGNSQDQASRREEKKEPSQQLTPTLTRRLRV